MEKPLPAIPAKRYFTIGEVSELCGVKPYVLRYWEQEFTQLKPMKRRGNRRYYQHHEVLLIRRIRDLLYDQGFTISGARNQLTDLAGAPRGGNAAVLDEADESFDTELDTRIDTRIDTNLDLAPNGLHVAAEPASHAPTTPPPDRLPSVALESPQLRAELLSIRDLLAG